MIAAPSNGRSRVARGTQRHLPHKLELEQSVIGGVIVEPNALALLDTIEPRDFYDHRHGAIWSAIRNLDNAGTPIDVLTVESELEHMGKLEAAGGIAYLGICAASVPIVSNVVEYARQVQSLATQRRLMQITSRATERSYDYGDDVRELIGETIRDLQDLDERHHAASSEIPFITPGRALEDLDRLARNPVFETPFPLLNAALGFGGMLGTQNYILAAHTGVGKTSFVANVANHIGLEHDVIVATWEMLPGYFVARIAAGPLRKHSNAIIRGDVPGADVLGAVSPGVTFLEEPSLALLRRAAEHLTKKRGRPPMIIVDYLQLLAAQLARGMDRPDPKVAVELASAELRSLAKDVGAVVLSVSATSRTTGRELSQDVRKRAPRDLIGAGRDSGSIEFDGAGVIVLSITDESDTDGAIATVTVAKARFGQSCHLDYRWIGQYGQWLEYGTAERTMKATTPEAPNKNANLRTSIAMVLRKAGSIDSKNKVHKLVGGTKGTCLKELDAMVEAGLVRITAFGFAMADAPSQTELHEVVREVES